MISAAFNDIFTYLLVIYFFFYFLILPLPVLWVGGSRCVTPGLDSGVDMCFYRLWSGAARNDVSSQVRLWAWTKWSVWKIFLFFLDHDFFLIGGASCCCCRRDCSFSLGLFSSTAFWIQSNYPPVYFSCISLFLFFFFKVYARGRVLNLFVRLKGAYTHKDES